MDDPDDAQIERILEQWFEERHAGGTPDLTRLCGGDEDLAAHVGTLLRQQEDLLGPVELREVRRPLPFDRLGDYELKSRIGSGGMGEVYLAREVSLDRMVALKVLRREFAADAIRRLRFRREALLMAALDHPNIAPIFGSGEDQGYVYLAMKLLPGTTMDRIATRFEPARMASIGARIARALHAAHEVEIVHRDVKPGNVQIDGDEAWVLDFGLARGRVDMTLTSEGEAPGTLAYMPPEQLRGDGSTFDPRGDIYSLGATLYQGVAGRPPFDADSPEALVRRVLLHDPRSLATGPADRDFDTILQRALEKDPSRRFQTALAMAEDLERFAAGESIESRPPSALSRGIKLMRRHRALAAGLAAALLVALVLGPQLWRNAQQRAAERARRFDLVQSSLDVEEPAVALRRLREMEQDPDAAGHARFADLRRVTTATLVRDALLDRIQLDCVYHQSVLDDEFTGALSDLPREVDVQELTTIARTFVAREQGDARELVRLTHVLGSSGACPRLVASLLAEQAGRELPVADAPPADGSRPVEDHVFTAVLLRLADAPQPAIDAEIDAALAVDAEHPRARMMLGVRHWIARDTERAAEVFGLLLDRDRPRAELHVMLAQLANYEGEPARARRHLEHARRSLAETGRAPNRWLAIAHVINETQLGDLDEAERLLAQARARFGDDEWFALCEVGVLLERADMTAAHAALTRLAEGAEVPWNRRRAASTLLQLDVMSAGDDVTEEQVRRLLDRAETLRATAADVHDLGTELEAALVAADLSSAMYEANLDAGAAAAATEWEGRFWRSIERVLAIDAQHAGAAFDAAQYVVNRVLAADAGDRAALRIGDQVFATRSRAIALVRRGIHDGEPIPNVAELATFAALLSAAVGDRDAATEMGSIAASRVEDVGEERASQLRAILRHTLQVLELGSWPPPR